MAKTMINTKRCPRCDGSLFLSEDPMDGLGTTYCLSGHTFYAKWIEVPRQTAPVLRGVATTAA